MSPSRYILNINTKEVHDAYNLQEQCNTDQITRKRRSTTIPISYSRCEHCMGK